MIAISAALIEARRNIPAAEARLLLRHVLSRSHAWLEAHGEETISDAEQRHFAELHGRRMAGEPIAYLLGWREFFGRRFEVAPGVLIPRPETELLVETALAKLARRRAPRILELGVGSGCVAVTLALELPDSQVTAVDLSAVALDLARRNARVHHANIEFIQGDWLAAFGREHFDLIVANPPYIAEADPHLAAGDLRFEPKMALASGADGLAALRAIVADAAEKLVDGGWLLLEHGYDQADAVAGLLAADGYLEIEQEQDLAGLMRVCGGRVVRRHA
jgi:release factor glutamine methyltransferase